MRKGKKKCESIKRNCEKSYKECGKVWLKGPLWKKWESVNKVKIVRKHDECLEKACEKKVNLWEKMRKCEQPEEGVRKYEKVQVSMRKCE